MVSVSAPKCLEWIAQPEIDKATAVKAKASATLDKSFSDNAHILQTIDILPGVPFYSIFICAIMSLES